MTTKKESGIDYNKMVKNTLSEMLKQKEKASNKWQDSELEEEGSNLIYKTTEALLCFIYPLEFKGKKEANDILLGNKWFLNDLELLLKAVEQHGFDPNPYSYLLQKVDFVDCASSILELLILIQKHLSFPRSFKLLKSNIETTASKAWKFLLESANCDKEGKISWAANKETHFKKQELTNIYFTSYVVNTFSLLFREEPWDFVKENREKILEMIYGGINWMFDRFDEGNQLLYFNRQNSIASLYDFGFLVYSVSSAYENLNDIVRDRFKLLAQVFICMPIESAEASRFIFYLPPEAKSPAYYDNRLSIGIVVAALCRIASLNLYTTENEQGLFRKLEVAYSLLISQRGSNNLWTSENYLVTPTLFGIIGLLYVGLFGRKGEYTIQEVELYNIIKKVLSDPSVVNTIANYIKKEIVEREQPEEGGE